MESKKPLAAALLSGGLDSVLAARHMQSLGVRIAGVTFTSVFTLNGVVSAPLTAVSQGMAMNFPVIVSDITAELWKRVRNPSHGYGSHLNPCIDCRILILRKAARIMDRIGADFLVTGEVVGQRPMSQRRGSIELIERMTGLKGKILRPLCAKWLEPTAAETNGLVDRSRLLDIKGRGRKAQLRLAEEYGLKEFTAPAGGCLLTDRGFSNRLLELMQNCPDCTIGDIRLLKLGRHFRLAPGVKAIVARNSAECELIENLAKPDDSVLEPADTPGPTTLVTGPADDSNLLHAARFTTYYSRHTRRLSQVRVAVRHQDRAPETLTVKPAKAEMIEAMSVS